jgi:hypothetical protein
MAIRDEIRERFSANLERVRGMVATYESLTGEGRGRRSITHADVLRAAVGLLHATLEELLRSLCEWKMASASPDSLSEIPLAGTRGKTKFGIQELAGFRGMSLDEVIAQSMNAFLNRFRCNHPGDVKAVFEKVGIDPKIVNEYTRTLAAMMSRRHLIAHRVDRNLMRGRGQHAATSLSSSKATYRTAAVERLGHEVLSSS